MMPDQFQHSSAALMQCTMCTDLESRDVHQYCTDQDINVVTFQKKTCSVFQFLHCIHTVLYLHDSDDPIILTF